MRIEVICTGEEVLTGKIVNSNFATISQKLEDAGGIALTIEGFGSTPEYAAKCCARTTTSRSASRIASASSRNRRTPIAPAATSRRA